MTNRLAKQSSPYLLQHKDNPVDWYPWGEEALVEAKKSDKPIFLSIGYAACHWCHVMEHESFEDKETAEIMNRNFINIKVDREERPDLDGIYMDAVVSLTGQGGWPMSVFLTPGKQPFYGGTYFPPVRRYNMPSFKEVLLSIAKAWEENREGLVKSGEEITEHILAKSLSPEDSRPIDPETIDQAALTLTQNYDWRNGGWGNAPKFPQPMIIQFLLSRGSEGDKLALDIATHALGAMAKGGMYDVVGGGFARYSVDDEWLVPHFEKMLYDNAQLARVYLHAYLLTGNNFFRHICEETLDFVVREMTHSQGGFFSSLDADSEGEEGKFYIWSHDEIESIFKDQKDFQLFKAAYALTRKGNFEGRTILRRAVDDKQLSKQFKIPVEQIPEKLKELHNILLLERGARVRPGTDNKVLVSWNALMSIAFAEAARYLKRPDYLAIAQKNARFLIDELHPEDRLLRSWREGVANHNAYLEDYAAFILALLELYQSDQNPFWFQTSENLTKDLITHFQDHEGGFFDTRNDHEELLTRPKDVQDNAVPSGNALAALALLKHSAFTGNAEYYELAIKLLSTLQEAMKKYPTAFGKWLYALFFAFQAIEEIAILGDMQDTKTQDLIETVWSQLRPFTVVAVSKSPPLKGSPPLLNNRPLLDNKPTAYVCNNFICKKPVNSPEELGVLIN
ncbi:MAG: thioredoxin domain-containing protein [Chloroflexi bacterium]|nr:thioredoxin domain-containing protein [Chloroflexota bacterium]